jgi:YHS domain-containing protein
LKLSLWATAVVGGALLASGAIGLRADQQATCPVTGQKFAVTDKTVSLTVNGQKQSFCCADCPAAFVKDPGKYIKTPMTCPVMTSNKVNLATAPRLAINDNLFLTCCGGCPSAIVSNPEKYMKELRDPVSGNSFQVSANMPHSQYRGVHYFFSSEENKKTFDAAPDKYSNKLLSQAG